MKNKVRIYLATEAFCKLQKILCECQNIFDQYHLDRRKEIGLDILVIKETADDALKFIELLR